MREALLARRLYTTEDLVEYPVIEMEDGHVLRIEAGSPNASTETLLPAFFDVHVHGAVCYDFMAATATEMDAIGRFLATKGTAYYLPTTVTGPVEATLRALERLAKQIARRTPHDAAMPVAINLEGPFLCGVKRGVHPLEHLQAPSITLFERFQAAAEGQIRLMTVAPEVPGALDLIAHVVAQGVRVSVGHSNATAEETRLAIAAGATSATHTFNAMRGLGHREPGMVGAVLDTEALYAEAIVDGVHLDPAIVRLWFRSKGEQRAILVTDGMSAMGMPDGTYKLGELVVEVREGVCMSGGVLAGSVLTLDRAVDNLCRMTGAALPTAVRLASRNPAAMLGMESLFTLGPGSPAHFNVYGEDGVRRGSILHGRRVPV